MRSLTITLVLVLALLAMPALAGPLKCPADSAPVGPTCVDHYEASAWSTPPGNAGLIKKVQEGKATLANLLAGGATLHGCFTGQTAYPATFAFDGTWTVPVYAVSVAGVLPSGCITWLQAEQACALSGKRLLTNQEWQRAAAGTPDAGFVPGPTDCNTHSGGPSQTGGRANCRSAWGAFDMGGNVWEWVGDWGTLTSGCRTWPGGLGDDLTCMGVSGASYPGALIRGGSYGNETGSGVLAVAGTWAPVLSDSSIGFRCAR